MAMEAPPKEGQKAPDQKETAEVVKAKPWYQRIPVLSKFFNWLSESLSSIYRRLKNKFTKPKTEVPKSLEEELQSPEALAGALPEDRRKSIEGERPSAEASQTSPETVQTVPVSTETQKLVSATVLKSESTFVALEEPLLKSQPPTDMPPATVGQPIIVPRETIHNRQPIIVYSSPGLQSANNELKKLPADLKSEIQKGATRLSDIVEEVIPSKKKQNNAWTRLKAKMSPNKNKKEKVEKLGKLQKVDTAEHTPEKVSRKRSFR